MKRDDSSIEAYVASVPDGQLAIFSHLRDLVLAPVPEAKEEIRWGMLTYDDNGALFSLGAQKHHVSLYVMATQALKDMAEELSTIDHGRGCLRFKKLSDIPTDTIRKLLLHARSTSECECSKQP
jgi:uncharacterized protein YdhG (YjbR/CyaY superfamily)